MLRTVGKHDVDTHVEVKLTFLRSSQSGKANGNLKMADIPEKAATNRVIREYFTSDASQSSRQHHLMIRKCVFGKAIIALHE